MKIPHLFFAAILSVATVNAQSSFNLLERSEFTAPVLTSGALKSYTTFTLDADELKKLISAAPDKLTLAFPVSDGTTLTVALDKKSIFAADFTVNTPSGKHANIERGIHYSGDVENDETGIAAFSFFSNAIYGIIATDAGNFNIVALEDSITRLPTNRYVIYNDHDLTVAKTFKCGTGDLPVHEVPSGEKSVSGSGCKLIEKYYECDYEMFLDRGSNITNTVNYTTAIFNVVRTVFHMESINFVLSEVFVWDEQDAYPTSNAALYTFGDMRQDNFNGDLAHFLTTRNEGNGGLAWLDVLCQSYDPNSSYGRFAYSNISNSFSSLPAYSWTVFVISHETGHNLGSPHTQWCGWPTGMGTTSSIDSCFTTEDFDGNSCYQGAAIPRRGTIMSYCHLTSSGVNLNLGFGPLPGLLIRSEVDDANCLQSAPAPDVPVITQVGNTLVFTPYDPNNTYQWRRANNLAVGTDTSYYNPTLAGGYFVMVMNPEGCSARSEMFMFEVSTVSTPGWQNTDAFQVWPNPSAGTLYFPVATGQSPEFSVYDMSGRCMGSGQAVNGSVSTELLPSGMYVLEVKNGEIVNRAKFLVN